MQLLRSAEQVIEALGGVKKVAGLMSVSPAAVYKWCSDGKFPANRMFRFKHLLEPKFSTASNLWKMKER